MRIILIREGKEGLDMEKHDFQVDTIHGVFTYRVASLIINNNKLLVAKHIEHPCFYAVGGRVKLNETSCDAVVREVLEETGFTLEIDRLAFGTNILDGTYTDQGEKEILHWLPIDELEHVNIVPNFLKTNLTKINENITHIISKE